MSLVICKILFSTFRSKRILSIWLQRITVSGGYTNLLLSSEETNLYVNLGSPRCVSLLMFNSNNITRDIVKRAVEQGNKPISHDYNSPTATFFAYFDTSIYHPGEVPYLNNIRPSHIHLPTEHHLLPNKPRLTHPTTAFRPPHREDHLTAIGSSHRPQHLPSR